MYVRGVMDRGKNEITDSDRLLFVDGEVIRGQGCKNERGWWH